ncbi:MAG TPA: hypothetical protein VM431_01295 [Phycisphaerae bacterium]|nr:hypothetical protein [Phycisphaerae bacterium]
MTANPSSWQSKRWTVLASLVVVAVLYGVVWYLMGGCEPSPAPPAVPGEGAGAEPSVETSSGAVQMFKAMQDPNVVELAYQIACFHAHKKRLPASLDEVRQHTAAWGGQPTPTATRRGIPLTYQPQADRTYTIVVEEKAGPAGQVRAVRIPAEVPVEMPIEMEPDALRVWWDLEYQKQLLDRMRQRLKAVESPPPPD